MSRPRPKIPDALRSLARTARKTGWTLARRGSGHVEWRSPSGEVIITASTPSCSRSSANARARLKRAGLKERP